LAVASANPVSRSSSMSRPACAIVRGLLVTVLFLILAMGIYYLLDCGVKVEKVGTK